MAERGRGGHNHLVRSLFGFLLLTSCARQPAAAPADVTAATLADDEEGVIANGCVDQVKFDGHNVYYLIGGRALLSSSKRGGPARTLIQSSDYVRYALAPDGVWAVDGEKVAWLAPDGARRTFAADQDVFSIATDATAMYWEVKAQSGSRILRVPRDGSARSELAAGRIRGWVLMGSQLVTSIDGTLQTIDIATGAHDPITAIADGYVAHADAEWIYFHLEGVLYRVPRAGGTATVVARARLFSFSGERAYYVAQSEVRSVRIDGTDDRSEQIEVGDHPVVLHLDPPFAYVATIDGPYETCSAGSIARRRLP